MPEGYIVRQEGDKKYLVIDTREWTWGKSIADYEEAMGYVINTLMEESADVVVLTGIYERLYNEEQTKLLREIAMIAHKFEQVKIWGNARLGDPQCPYDTDMTSRHDTMITLGYELIKTDPVKAYVSCIQAIQKEKSRINAAGDFTQKCKPVYLNTLIYTKRLMETSNLIKKARVYLAKLKKYPEGRRIYHSFFESQIKPSFVGSRLLFGEIENLELLDQYDIDGTPVQIYNQPNKLEQLYYVNPPEYSMSPEKYFILTKTKEIVAEYRPGKSEVSAAKANRDYFERIYKSTIEDVAEGSNVKLSEKEKESLSKLVARYTIGYGIL
ncbi:MAG: hypothetical protein GOV15_04600, partial [Candidatus Diapherotrites archaeon]|nr:hypothetical protein [Candidatus Diapherotrites archaeon]